MGSPDLDGRVPLMGGTAPRDRTVTQYRTEIDARLEEYRGIRPDPGKDELALLETALFVEEALGMRVRDDEIVAENLGTFEAIRRFVARRQGGA
jgi:hypothetical protein